MTAQKIKNFALSSTGIQMIITFIFLAIVSWVGLKAKDTFFPKERGEVIEEKVVKLEHEMKGSHEVLLLKMEHTDEKIDGLIRVNEKMIDMYLNSRNQ